MRAFKDEEDEEEVIFFDMAMKLKRKKKETRVLAPPVAGKTVKAMTPLDLDIKGEVWTYTYFPVLNPGLYNKPRPIQNFIKELNNAVKWKIDNKTIGKMTTSKWAKYLFETIFNLWFYVMSTTLQKYNKDAEKIFRYSKTIIEFLKKKLGGIKEIEFVYKKLFEACMKCKLHDEAGKLRDEMKSITFAFQDTNQRTFIPTDGKGMKIIQKEEEKKEEDLETDNEAAQVSYVLENVVIFAAAQCKNTTCNYIIKEEEIMTGWQQSMNEYISQCPLCKAKFVPKLILLTDSEHESLNGKDGLEIQWLPPSCLMKEFTNCITQRGDSILLKEDLRKDHSAIYWNLVFYFKLMKLPYFFLDQYSSYSSRQIESLSLYQPIDSKKRTSTVSTKTSLNKDALRKLNEASKESSHLEVFARSVNRPPSLYEGAMGGHDSNSINIDTLSQTDSVAKPRRPGSVVNFGRGNSTKRSSRGGSASQRSNSGSCVGSISDFERIDQANRGSSKANKYINKLFSKYCEEFRNLMHMKNQDLALSDLKFDEMPSELAKQFTNVGKKGFSTPSMSKAQSDNTTFPRDVNTGFKADDIISSITLSKFPSTDPKMHSSSMNDANSYVSKESEKEQVSRFKPPPGTSLKPTKFKVQSSPMKVIKKSRLRIKK